MKRRPLCPAVSSAHSGIRLQNVGVYGTITGMEYFNTSFQIVMPLVLMMATGFLLRRTGIVSEDAFRIINRIVYYVGTVLTDMYAEESVGDAMQILSILRSYMHRIDLAQIRADVQHRFDKKNTIELVWGQKGGIAPDTLGQLLAEEGIHLDAIPIQPELSI